MPREAQESASGNVFRLLYRSRNRIPVSDSKRELGALFTHARRNNKSRHICGALLVYGDWFVQVLEGDELAVRELLARIERDPRHEHVAVLEAGMAEERIFARWAMARVSEDEKPDIPLIAHTDGISPAASRGTTPKQDAVLAVMREALRSAPQPV